MTCPAIRNLVRGISENVFMLLIIDFLLNQIQWQEFAEMTQSFFICTVQMSIPELGKNMDFSKRVFCFIFLN